MVRRRKVAAKAPSDMFGLASALRRLERMEVVVNERRRSGEIMGTVRGGNLIEQN